MPPDQRGGIALGAWHLLGPVEEGRHAMALAFSDALSWIKAAPVSKALAHDLENEEAKIHLCPHDEHTVSNFPFAGVEPFSDGKAVVAMGLRHISGCRNHVPG